MVRLVKYGPYRGWSDERARKALLDRANREGWRILYLGSGGRRQGGMVNVDITAETGPDVVADGYALPFPDGCFDAIFCESVVEHVPDPERFLAQASRCLRPGGLWYLEAPFLQPRHAPVDFQRWTVAGFQAALVRAGLEPIDCGLHLGPGFMLAWVLRDGGAMILSGGIGWLSRGWGWLLGFLLCPLYLLDIALLRWPGAIELACAIWYVARRPGPDVEP